jgi:hypothetical protein
LCSAAVPTGRSPGEQNSPTFVVFVSAAAVDVASITPLLSLLLEAQSVFTLKFLFVLLGAKRVKDELGGHEDSFSGSSLKRAALHLKSINHKS